MVIILEHYFTNNQNLKSSMRTIKHTIDNFVFTFYSDLGVFSKNKIDYGSKSLVKAIIKDNIRPPNLLDVGCGYGFIGITLGKILSSKVTLSDINERALKLASKNILENNVDGKVILSNAYENIDGTYQMIVTNPPIRAGKKVVLEILKGAHAHLDKDGVLYYVIRKDQGAKSIIKELDEIYENEIIAKDKGFYCIKAKSR